MLVGLSTARVPVEAAPVVQHRPGRSHIADHKQIFQSAVFYIRISTHSIKYWVACLGWGMWLGEDPRTSVASVCIFTFFPRAVIKICLAGGIDVFRTIHDFNASGLNSQREWSQRAFT